ncbi:MAG: cupredoxin domain-containing protein [Bradyrhizobium sp.]|uniref:cupredoxin domain-containing protein n=1 Tax=Bradyrhizobium sp. TaxID=376 RepID=UPI0025B8D3B2|nr:cupredoxin domain-containing protein [Bradyrhizobium sp.]MBI5260706.1 cupredoxin domain-containing protein [Bradyrhizobium sp.]
MMVRLSAAIAAIFLLSSSALAGTVRISTENRNFLPAETTAKVGDTVEWVNKDAFAHTATARGGDFDVNMPPKKTGRVVLKKAGTVAYYCRHHPNMRATIKIEP